MTSSFPKIMKGVTAATALATAALAVAYRFFPSDWVLSAAITAGTTFYHFAMRLLVGSIVPLCVHSPMNRQWFRQKSFEPRLYDHLQVKRWKDHMPTYDPAAFSMGNNSLEQIVYNSCVSEAVHEVIVPAYTYIATALTVEYPIGMTDGSHPMIQKLISWYAGGACFNGKSWDITVPSSNDYPHAPWWHSESESTCHTDYNGTAQIAGFLIRYAPRQSEAFHLCGSQESAQRQFLQRLCPPHPVHDRPDPG